MESFILLIKLSYFVHSAIICIRSDNSVVIVSKSRQMGDDLKLNRTVITAQVANMSSPNLSAAVGLAVNACPEPLDLKIKSYLKCLKKTCVTSIPDSTPSPFVGSSLAGGANTWGSSFPGIF